jgi:protein-S-isoprenylcysteine O-methyltransferase Ste14
MALQEEFEKQGNILFIYRSYFPLIILLFGMILFIQKEMNPEMFILSNTPYELLYEIGALIIGLLGLAVRIYTVGHTPKNTSGRNTKEGQVADTLNTTGIYSVVRHPLYLGNFLMWLSPAMLTGNFWFIIVFCLIYWVYYERIMFAEEQFLRGKFGEDYLKWSENVSAFIPRLKNFQKANMPFSWKKVVKKEKNGLFALFLIFTVFDIIGERIHNTDNYNYFLIAMCILTGIGYVILKYLKMKTQLLDEPNR